MTPIGMHLLFTVTLVFLGVAIATDLRTRRIPNVVTGPAILAGLGLNAWISGWDGLTASVLGCLAATAILICPFALGGVGGGDVKMMAAVGALLGPRLAFYSLVLGLVLGGVVAVVQLARRARLHEKLAAMYRMAVNAVLARSMEPLRLSSSDPNAVVLPYSLPLGVGTAAVIAVSLVVRP